MLYKAHDNTEFIVIITIKPRGRTMSSSTFKNNTIYVQNQKIYLKSEIHNKKYAFLSKRRREEEKVQSVNCQFEF